MKTKTLYTCEICHTDFANEKDAIACEKHHSQKLNIVGMRYLPLRASRNSDEAEGFPVSITVRDENGDEVVYER